MGSTVHHGPRQCGQACPLPSHDLRQMAPGPPEPEADGHLGCGPFRAVAGKADVDGGVRVSTWTPAPLSGPGFLVSLFPTAFSHAIHW